MLINFDMKIELNKLFESLKLANKPNTKAEAKIEQILAYLEVIHADLRKYSKKRKLVLLESCAGNCYLSFLIYYFYSKICKREIELYCVDINKKLMEKAMNLANDYGFTGMKFIASDVKKFSLNKKVDIVFSLHACDTATDATLFLGLKHQAKLILSVSCCQHSIKKTFRSSVYSPITRHRIFKDRIVYMIGDSLRALLLEQNGYSANIFEFVSSRHTDKNIMLRAKIGTNSKRNEIEKEYAKISGEFNIKPFLETYINSKNQNAR